MLSIKQINKVLLEIESPLKATQGDKGVAIVDKEGLQLVIPEAARTAGFIKALSYQWENGAPAGAIKV